MTPVRKIILGTLALKNKKLVRKVKGEWFFVLLCCNIREGGKESVCVCVCLPKKPQQTAT